MVLNKSVIGLIVIINLILVVAFVFPGILPVRISIDIILLALSICFSGTVIALLTYIVIQFNKI